MPDKKPTLPAIVEHTEELVFNSCYAPFDLSGLLQSSENRSRIRKLPATQLFYSLDSLEPEEMQLLLPHITGEQWTTFLDLDLWEKDELNTNALIHWESFTLETEDAVARKLLRATDPELLQLLWKRELQIIARVEEDEFETEPPVDRSTFITPDNNYLVVLPEDPEKSRLIHSFITRLYQLDPDYARLSLEASRFALSLELEEDAYQNTRRRIEDYGFQDYFNAVEIYSPRSADSLLPEKDNPLPGASKELPVPLDHGRHSSGFVFLEALAAVSSRDDIDPLLQEMFFVCNKVISADRGRPGDTEAVRAGISKAINGISLGLDTWSGGDLNRAIEGITSHHLTSFFQIGYDSLLQVKRKADSAPEQDAGSLGEAVIENLRSPYPRYTESQEKEGKISFTARYFRNASEIEETTKMLEQLKA